MSKEDLTFKSTLEALSKEWSFLTGIGNVCLPENDSVNARIIALSKNQQELFLRINTLRTRIIDLDRRLRLNETKKGKWWNK